MAEHLGFRVSVDASEMCKDIRSRFFIYIDLLRDRNIHDIENRIRTYLCVDKPISLMIGSFYLPSSENVRLLCVGDALKVVEQNKECCTDKEDDNCPCKDGDSGYNHIYLKEHKTKKKKYISGDVNDNSSNTEKESVWKCETLPVSLDKCTEYPKPKGKKRKKKSEDDRSCMSDEQYVTEKSKCKELLDGVQDLEEQENERINNKKENYGDTKSGGDIYNSVMTVTETSEQLRSEIAMRESLENGITSSIEMGLCAETVQDNGSSQMKEISIKRHRKRIRQRKKNHGPEHNKTVGKFPASLVNPKREALIQNIAAPRTHIRFSDWDVDVNTDSLVDTKVETCDMSQMESKDAFTSHVSVQLSGLQPVITSGNKDSASSELNGQEVGELKNVASHEQSSTKCDVQALENSQPDDLCSGSSCNNDMFAKLRAFENFSVPRVYQRKKSSVTTDSTVNGTTPETLSNTDVGNTGQIKTDNTEINFHQFPILKGTPKKGDIIAFKMLKMGEDYTPQISDYITAQVLCACKETYQLRLKILGGHEQCQQPKGKFHIKDDNTPDICIADDLVVNWNEILETKLVFP